MFISIILFILILGVLVFLHEFGHFYSARKLGINVEEFGFGFPPRIYGIKKGQTIYSINWIPFGGFVRLKGEQEHIKEPDSFSSQSAWKRLTVIISGVFMNVILAMLILSLVFALGVPSMVDDQSTIYPGGKVSKQQLQIFSVEEDSPAEQAGLKSGDVILSIRNNEIESLEQAQILLNVNEEIDISYSSSGQENFLVITPIIIDEEGVYKIGVSLIESGFVSYPWYQAIWLGPWYAIQLLGLIFFSIWDFFKGLLTQGTISPDVAGPVGIAVITGQVADMGFIYLLQFSAILSLSLAVMNILPIPALDGGRAMFIIIEKIRKKPISQNIEGIIHTVGFYALILLLIFISYKDFIRFNVGEKISEFFQRIGT
ncbi:MAG: M50 family metallopeptidase [bacterium]